jgi:hypothetical protein
MRFRRNSGNRSIALHAAYTSRGGRRIVIRQRRRVCATAAGRVSDLKRRTANAVPSAITNRAIGRTGSACMVAKRSNARARRMATAVPVKPLDRL